MKPARQLQLSEAALAEEVVCQLTATNPTAPANVTRYIPRDRTFRQHTSFPLPSPQMRLMRMRI